MKAPRVPKEIKVPIKPRRKKVKTVSEDTKVTYKVLREGGSTMVNQLFELYKIDRYKARVKYMNNPRGYTYTRLVIFEFGENDFEISEFENKFGVSVTNKIYSSQKKLASITFKKGKFYYINRNKNKITPLTLAGVISFIRTTENYYGDKLQTESQVYEYLVGRMPWIQTVFETDAAHGLAFNTIMSKKLTGQKDLLRYVFKVPINIVNIITNNVQSVYMNGENKAMIRATNRPRSAIEALKQWKEISKVLDGVQNLTLEFYHHPHFYDTCNMAHKLGRKVNCRWGIKKLEQMHDDWAKDLGNILLDCEIEYVLKVRKPYFGLAKHTGWKLLFTNKEMLVEGVRQNHCVGGYIDRVERGECAIFHVDGYTLQVGIDRNARFENGNATTIRVIGGDGEITDSILTKEMKAINPNEKPVLFFKASNLQFRGKHNCSPPVELVDSVNKMLDEYSRTEEFQILASGNGVIENFNLVCDEIYKTKWEVVINHETHNYEILTDVGLNGLEAKEVLGLNQTAQFAGNRLEVNNFQVNNFRFEIPEELPF